MWVRVMLGCNKRQLEGLAAHVHTWPQLTVSALRHVVSTTCCSFSATGAGLKSQTRGWAKWETQPALPRWYWCVSKVRVSDRDNTCDLLMLLHIIVSRRLIGWAPVSGSLNPDLAELSAVAKTRQESESAGGPLIRKLHGVLILDTDRIPSVFSWLPLPARLSPLWTAEPSRRPGVPEPRCQRHLVFTKLGTTERFCLRVFESSDFWRGCVWMALHVKAIYVMAYFIDDLSPINMTNQAILVHFFALLKNKVTDLLTFYWQWLWALCLKFPINHL